MNGRELRIAGSVRITLKRGEVGETSTTPSRLYRPPRTAFKGAATVITVKRSVGSWP